MGKTVEGVTCTVASAVGYGLMSIFANYAYRGGITVPTLLFLRFTIACVILFGYLAARGIDVKVTIKHLGGLAILGGVGYALQSTCYFSALRYIPTSLVALLLYTYPMFVIVIARLVEDERISFGRVVAIGIALAGLAAVLAPSLERVNATGILLALGTAIVYSGYITLGNRLLRQLSPLVTSAYVALFASFSFICIGTVTGALTFDFADSSWLPTILIALVSTVIAMLTFFRGVELIGATRTSVISMIEPLVTIGFASALFGEHLSPMQVAGGCAVLGGAVATVLIKAPQAAGHSVRTDSQSRSM